MSFGIDFQYIYFILSRFLKDEINGARVTKFQTSYIRDTTNSSHKTFINLCHRVNSMWWVNQELEPLGVVALHRI